jgi:hypothetical protein
MSLYDLGVALARMLLATMPVYRDFYPGGDRNIIWPLELMAGESDAFRVEVMA